MTSLLQTAITSARREKIKHAYSDEEIELALAWIDNKVTYKQISIVLKMRGSNLYNFIAIALREAYRQGKLTTK